MTLLKRVPPSRWAVILTWVGAALAWGTSVITNVAAHESPSGTGTTEQQDTPIKPASDAELPALPADGLVVIRYTPATTPPMQPGTVRASAPSAAPARTAPAPAVAPPTLPPSSGS